MYWGTLMTHPTMTHSQKKLPICNIPPRPLFTEYNNPTSPYGVMDLHGPQHLWTDTCLEQLQAPLPTPASVCDSLIHIVARPCMAMALEFIPLGIPYVASATHTTRVSYSLQLQHPRVPGPALPTVRLTCA
jgi:hypothetical protein